MDRLRPASLVSVALSVALSGRAVAAPLLAIDLDPATAGVQSNATIGVGSSLSLEIVISGVESVEPLNAFQLELAHDETVAMVLSATLGSFLLSPEVLLDSVVPGRVGLAVVTLGPGAVFGSGTLAAVTLQGSGVGTTGLTLENVLLSQPFGFPIDGFALQGALLTVVPEPATGSLALLGLIMLVVGGRRLA
jgi:hypothetical protein